MLSWVRLHTCKRWSAEGLLFSVFHYHRTNDDGFSEMVCTLVIDADILKTPMAYKYVVYSPKVTADDEYYEKLHSFVRSNNDDPNRCLWISPQEYESAYGGIYILCMLFF